MSLRAAEQLRPDLAHDRASFQDQQRTLDPTRLVFLDESGVTTNLVRRFGRAPRGERASGRAPAGRYEQLTLFGALTLDGMGTLMSLEGAADTASFLAFVREFLVPSLSPGQIVFLDNLSAHRCAEVEHVIEAAGCTLVFLPAYSPDFNPIEQAWSKIKEALRSAAARSREAIETALAAILDTITAADARGWFAHCGYHAN